MTSRVAEVSGRPVVAEGAEKGSVAEGFDTTM